MRSTPLALALALALATGCTSTQDGGGEGGREVAPDEIGFTPAARPSQHVELDDFDMDWEDIERDDAGEPSPFEVARWVKERRDGALKCLRATPPDVAQARKIMKNVLEKVPTATHVRALLAQTEFGVAAFFYKCGDRWAWEVQRIKFEKTAEPGGPELNEKDLAKLMADFDDAIAMANKQIRDHAQVALQHFDRYRQARPDDRAVADFIWKLYFYLQDYEKAKQWLDYVLREMDLNEVPEEEPIRQDYVLIRKSINEYLAKIKLEGVDRPGRGGLFPFSDQRSRSAGGRLSEGFTPGD